MFKAKVRCTFPLLMFLAACAGGERTADWPTAPFDADVFEIDCSQRDGQGRVHLTAEQFAKRSWASAKKFSEVQSTLERPVEVCGVPQELDLLTRLRCDDGTNPYGDRQAAHQSRQGSSCCAGRCGRPIDTYNVPCPEVLYQVHMDIYFCPEPDIHDVAWERSMAAGSAVAQQGEALAATSASLE